MVQARGLGIVEGPEVKQEALTVAYLQGCNQAQYLHPKAFLEEALPFHQEVHQGELQVEVALESRHLVRLEGFAEASQLHQSP